MKEKDFINRRDFVKRATVGVGAATLLGTSELASASISASTAWVRTVDVVVVGYGAAGAAAAIEATAAGAKVLILEKGKHGGGATYLSGGIWVCPKTPEDGFNYLKGVARPKDASEPYELDEEHLLQYTTEVSKNNEWLTGIGAKGITQAFKGWYDVPSQANYTAYILAGSPMGAGLYDLLKQAVTKRNIEVSYEAPVVELVTHASADGLSVEGVIANISGKRTAIRAKKGVILSCGGFDGNKQLKRNYLMPGLKSTSSPLNTGDAITLSAKVGAALWHLNSAAQIVGHEIPGIEEYSISQYVHSVPSSQISVNKYGKRFVDESLHSYDMMTRVALTYDAVHHEYPNNPFWVVFDEKLRASAPAGWGVPMGRPTDKYKWSADNSEEIRKGWILTGETIEELARAMKVDAETLAKTVKKYNEACANESDPEFGREGGLVPIEKGPFYAIRASVTTFCTSGGPRININGQVLDVHGKVVPGLYAAGAASSFGVAFVYPLSGTSIADSLVMGRITGRHAARKA